MEKPNRIFMFLLRLALGVSVFQAGWMKVSNHISMDGMAGMVKRGQGVFEFFTTGAMLPITNILITWGEILFGVSFVLGVCMRLSSTLGAVMFALFFLLVGTFPIDPLLLMMLSILVVGYSKHHLYALSNHKETCTRSGCPCKYLPN